MVLGFRTILSRLLDQPSESSTPRLNRAIFPPRSIIRYTLLEGILEENVGFPFVGEQSQEQVYVNESIHELQDLAPLGQSDLTQSFLPPLTC